MTIEYAHDRACETCGAPFSPRPDQIKRGAGRFCSQQCWRQSQKRPVIDNNDGSASIFLTRGKVAIIDTDDIPLVRDFVWSATNEGYAFSGISGFLHHLICPPSEGHEVDHIDGDTLNNRRSNLRSCPKSGNTKNRKVPSNSTTGLKGVSFHKATGKYAAYITANGKRQHLGLFESPNSAANAYNAAAVELHGEFARTNAVIANG